MRETRGSYTQIDAAFDIARSRGLGWRAGVLLYGLAWMGLRCPRVGNGGSQCEYLYNFLFRIKSAGTPLNKRTDSQNLLLTFRNS